MEYDELGFTEPRKFVYIDWDLGNKCNYKCDYCHPDAHAGDVGFPDIEDAKRFVTDIDTQVRRLGRFGRYNLLGGEPTLWRDLPEFSEHVKATNPDNRLQILTNGNRTLNWWKRTATYIDKAVVSVHVKQADIVELVDKFNALADDMYIAFQICIDSSIFSKSFDCHMYAYENLDPRIGVWHKPLQTVLGTGTMMPYTENQKQIMAKLPNNPGDNEPDSTTGLVKKLDGRIVEDTNCQSLIMNKQNNWRGWACYIGTDTLNINRKGIVTMGSSCNPDINLGRIGDHIELPLKPVVCNYSVCSCWADIEARKIKHYDITEVYK